MTLAFEDAYSKLVEVVTVADVIDEDCVSNSLLQIWKPRSELASQSDSELDTINDQTQVY